MDFTDKDDSRMIAKLKRLPTIPHAQYGEIISTADINALVSDYYNDYNWLYDHLKHLEKQGLLTLYRFDDTIIGANLV